MLLQMRRSCLRSASRLRSKRSDSSRSGGSSGGCTQQRRQRRLASSSRASRWARAQNRAAAAPTLRPVAERAADLRAEAVAFLRQYDVDAACGFVPRDSPAASLGPEYAAWDALAVQIPDLLSTGTCRVQVAKMPELDWKPLYVASMRDLHTASHATRDSRLTHTYGAGRWPGRKTRQRCGERSSCSHIFTTHASLKTPRNPQTLFRGHWQCPCVGFRKSSACLRR